MLEKKQILELILLTLIVGILVIGSSEIGSANQIISMGEYQTSISSSYISSKLDYSVEVLERDLFGQPTKVRIHWKWKEGMKEICLLKKLSEYDEESVIKYIDQFTTETNGTKEYLFGREPDTKLADDLKTLIADGLPIKGKQGEYLKVTGDSGSIDFIVPRFSQDYSISLGFSTATITLSKLGNNAYTNDPTPDFQFTPIGNESNYSCELFINGTGYGVNSTVSNNTLTTITANDSLSEGGYNWYINCTKGTVTDQSSTWYFTVDLTSPTLTFKNPTPGDNSYTAKNSTEVNISISENYKLNTFKFNWNTTNYSFYDDSLVLALNFNNNSAIGENSTYAVDISKYGNNGTFSTTAFFNSSYLYRKQLTITNNNDTNLTAGSPINFTIDTAGLISAGKMLSNCNDLRITYGATEINRTNSTACNSSETMIWFNAQAQINNGSSDSNYYVYYGNPSAGLPQTGGITTTQNYNLTISQGAENQIRAQYVTGKFGSALSFDGVDDYVDCGNDTSLQSALSHHNFTIELWMNPAEGASRWQDMITKKQSYSNTPGFDLFLLNNYLYWKSEGDSGNSYCFGSVLLSWTTDKWYHITAIFDGATLRLYRDVSKVKSLTCNESTMGTSASSLKIAKYLGGGYFNGTIDEVRIYNRSLTSEEIKMHYQSEFQKYNSTEWRFYGNVTNLTDGTYTYYGWANDSAGNENSTGIRMLMVDTSPCGVHNASFSLEANASVNGNCITIGADNVRINCQGYSITGNGSGIGINVTNRNSITINNCTISDFNYNILFYNSTNVKIYNKTLFNFHAYNTTNITVDLPLINCSYGFKGARIKDADWEYCSFNLTLEQGRVIYVESYEAKGIPHLIIIAFGAGGLTLLIYIWRRRLRRR